MKRRDVILEVSLRLFNEEGEASLSAVDISNELDISPGNLYYHFKGKEEIIAALYEQFEAGIILLLKDTKEAGDTLEEHWLHLYVVLEYIYHYRFFFRNITDLLQKYTVIDSRFHRLVEQQYQSIHTMLNNLLDEGVLAGGDTEIRIDELADNMMLIYTHWFEFQNLRKRQLDQHQFIQSAILQIMTLLAPYMGDLQRQFMEECNALYQRDKQG
ncbi:MAG TPA: TetR/AcrR family transcriptional regulator [Porticoccus sp.]|nr:TetR/AcrR family transcriptional regulator [Porticoccus sp.]